jgi:hypothetical protein
MASLDEFLGESAAPDAYLWTLRDASRTGAHPARRAGESTAGSSLWIPPVPSI